MLRITVVRVSPDCDCAEVLGYADICQMRGHSPRSSHQVRVFDNAGELEVTAYLSQYWLRGSTVWDFVVRGMATAVMGTEQVPPRLSHRASSNELA